MANRPISRAKNFDFESVKTKRWNLREFTNPQRWSGFVSTEEPTFGDLVKELYGHVTVKEKNEEKFIVSTAKGVKIKMTQEFLSKALNIPKPL